MPQMAPMMWLNLFIVFLASLMCFVVMNYSIIPMNKIYQPTSSKKKSEKNWKW
uniref:ATP synthase F0 subunit 8 n=1 Tax=Jasus edwardsii TaxID=95461 RepID=UPI00315C9AC6